MAVVLVSQTPADNTLGWDPSLPMTIIVESTDSTMRTDRSDIALVDFSLVVDNGVGATNYPTGYDWQVSQTLSLGDTRLTFEFMPFGGWPPNTRFGAPTGVDLGLPNPFTFLYWFFRDVAGAFLDAYDTMQFSTGAAASAPVSITTTSLPPAPVDEPYSETVEAEDGTEPYAWEVTDGALPPGLALDEDTGEISGTPTTPGTYVVEVTVTDDGSDTDTVELTIVVTAPWAWAPLTAEETAAIAADRPLLVAPNAVADRHEDAEWRSSLAWDSGVDETRVNVAVRWRTTRAHDGLGDIDTQGPAAEPSAFLMSLRSGRFNVAMVGGHNFAETEPAAVRLEVADDEGYSINLHTLAEWTGDWGRRLVAVRLATDLDADGVTIENARYVRLVVEGGVVARAAIGELYLGLMYAPPHAQEYEDDETALASRVDTTRADNGAGQDVASYSGRLSTSLRWRPDTAAYETLFREWFAAARYGGGAFLYIPRPSFDERVCYLCRTSPEQALVNTAARAFEVVIPLEEQAPFVAKENDL